ncbi:MAG: NAD(P)-dependent glycerol-3-phosphate dehydrogenase [Elusimicrobia bacterium]|nr:NAD(P)-dependent glycerol-3-phosphate dehydrogenase [Candidatus Obscuribacterium magneticum]
MTPANKEKIAVLGGGAWGSTLAAHLAEYDHDVFLWEFSPEVAEQLKTARTLKTIPKLRLPRDVQVTHRIDEAVKGRNIVVCAVPSHTVRPTFTALSENKLLPKNALVIIATKGLERNTDERMSEIIRVLLPGLNDLVTFTGPSHAEEIVLGQPVVMVAASESPEVAHRVRSLFMSDKFRIYTSRDTIGVELGGALKNIYALACGIVDGLGLGDNVKAALMTRGLVEMTRLGTALGAKAVTFFGLSGLGDLIVTCNSRHSRNRLLGEKIGSGKSFEEAMSEMTMVAEGVNTTRSAHHLAQRHGVEAPIINEMHQVLFENKSPRDSIKDLMSRQVRSEMEGIVL